MAASGESGGLLVPESGVKSSRASSPAPAGMTMSGLGVSGLPKTSLQQVWGRATLLSLLLTPSLSLQAARDGREDVVRAHLTRLPRQNTSKILNGKDADGFTALHYAAKFNRFKILQLLITSGASEPPA